MGNVKIGDLFTLEKGELQSTKCTPGKYNFITAAEAWKTHNTYTHECEALIFAAAASGSLGRTHYVKGKFVTSDLCFVLRPKSPNKYPINLHFYYYIFNGLQKDIVGQTKTGTSKESINQKNLKSYNLPYFSMDEQNRHLEKIKLCDMTSKSLREEISYQRPLLAKLRQSLLQIAVQGKLVKQNPNDEPASELLKKIKAEKEKLIKEGKIKKQKPLPSVEPDEIPYKLPKGWEWEKAGKLFFVTKLAGFEYTKYINLKDQGDVPVIRAQNVRINRIDDTKLKYIEEEVSRLLERSALTKTAILVTFIGAGIGDVAVFDKKQRWHLAPNVAKMEPYNNYSKNICVKYIIYFLMSPKGRDEIFKHIKSTAQPSLSMKTIRDINIPLPSLNEQKRIVAKVDELMALCDELEEKLKQSREKNEKLMDATIHHLLVA